MDSLFFISLIAIAIFAAWVSQYDKIGALLVALLGIVGLAVYTGNLELIGMLPMGIVVVPMSDKWTAKRVESHRSDFISNLVEFAQCQEIAVSWYDKARQVMRHLSDIFDISIETVCGVTSALSPMVNWTANIKNAADMLQYGNMATVQAYKHNRTKALAILSGVKPLDAITAVKTYHFYHNLLDSNYHTTIDVWALRAMIGNPSERRDVAYYTFNTRPKIKTVLSIFQEASIIHGFPPCGTQAAAWVECRRRANQADEIIKHWIVDYWNDINK